MTKAVLAQRPNNATHLLMNMRKEIHEPEIETAEYRSTRPQRTYCENTDRPG